MRAMRMIVMEIKWVYIVLRWFVVGLSAMGSRSMRLGFAKTGRYSLYLCKGGAAYTNDEYAFPFSYHRSRL
jgi:hypothetical protein